jgi:hypothetical protein
MTTEPKGLDESSGDHRWPSLPLAEWEATRDTLQLWTQMVGKVRMANTPMVNHWWNVPLYVTARGFTTSLIPHGRGPSFQIDFDLQVHQLEIVTDTDERRSLRLESQPVAQFYAELMSRLDELGLGTDIWTMPVEIEGAIPFDEDQLHTTYDPDQAHRFWRLLVQSDRVLHEFRSRFIGKASPVHLFWGGLDLAVTRFSGRAAPPHWGSPPHCGPQVMLEAYSHEVSSCGYWPGGGGEGLFYSYAYPEPEGFRDARVDPDAASYQGDLGEFVLPYEAVRTASDPDRVLLDFLQTTYEAAATNGDWDRQALEREPPELATTAGETAT